MNQGFNDILLQSEDNIDLAEDSAWRMPSDRSGEPSKISLMPGKKDSRQTKANPRLIVQLEKNVA